MNAIDIIVPSPGESVSEAQMASWLVGNGDYVEKDSEIAEIDSEKATLSLVAPASGIIEILAQKGQVVKIGAVVARITPSTADAAGHKVKKSSEPLVKTPEQKPVKVQETLESPIDEKAGLRMTPLARNVLEKNGFTEKDLLEYIRNHRFGLNDVNDFIENRKPNPNNSLSSSAKEISSRKPAENETMEPMSMLRRKLAERLVAVKNQTAMLTTFNEADMTSLNQIRSDYKDRFLEKHGVKLSMMSFFTLAASRALTQFPMVAAQIHGDQILTFGYTDIGIAVSTPKGLMVPVIRGIEKMSLPETEKAIAAMAEKARSGKMALSDMQGGTFTITNGGVFGSLLSTPILNPPQSAILGMHNIVERPVVKNGQVLAAPMMYLALSYDHRVIDGRESVGFLIRIKELIENPLALLPENASVETLLDL